MSQNMTAQKQLYEPAEHKAVSRTRVFISTSTFAKADRRPLELLESAGVGYEQNPLGRTLNRNEIGAYLEGIDGVIAGTEPLDRAVLSQLRSLRVISRCGVGLDNVDLAAARELGIQVFNTPEAPVDAVAELTLSGMLLLLRHVCLLDVSIRQGRWQKRLGRLLRNRTVGIIGLGRIGKALVRLLQPFEVRILANDVCTDEVFASQYEVRYCSIESLLQESDIVTIHCPYSVETHRLLERNRIGMMRPGGILVNCARGGIVDEDALYEALKAEHLGGAFIDTFEQEPYSGRLIDLPNVVLSPHVGSYSIECRVRMEIESVENLLRALPALGVPSERQLAAPAS